MGHIHVPAHHHRLLLLETEQIVPEGIFPFHPVGKACQPPLGVGGIHIHQEKLREPAGDDPALGVMLRQPQAISYIQGFFFGKDRRAGIALLLGAVPILKIAGGVHLRLLFLHLGFLDAEDIGLTFLKIIQKSFSQTGPQAVDIP